MGARRDDKDGKEVGRGRPPAHSQFAKGQSGNPKGRPRKERDLRKLVDAELDQTVFITEGDRRVRLTKREIMVKKLVNGAVRGEDKPLLALLKLIGSGAEPDPVANIDPAEIARYALRYLPKDGLPPAEGSAHPRDDEAAPESKGGKA